MGFASYRSCFLEVLALFQYLMPVTTNKNIYKNNLSKFAEKYPRDFYNMATKLIPTELTGAIDNHLTLKIVRGKSNLK